mmetsp:Transcript_44151/g.64914  ORF Transcript_44151/g.64914 Transcript_44151/m.64914 type:complete len:91 (-) Transcript_44151:143-415(-)
MRIPQERLEINLVHGSHNAPPRRRANRRCVTLPMGHQRVLTADIPDLIDGEHHALVWDDDIDGSVLQQVDGFSYLTLLEEVFTLLKRFGG